MEGDNLVNIGIIDADLIDKGTRHPNLALLKISAYNKEIGNNVKLLTDYKEIPNYDHVYISKVFRYTEVSQDLKKIKTSLSEGPVFTLMVEETYLLK
jgi:hypothetical protein